MHALILAGGRGSRLRADGISEPKPFVAVGGQPLVIRLTETLRGLGCPTVTVAIRDSVLASAGDLRGRAEAAGCRFVSVHTPSSLHTLALGLERLAPGPVVCTMVDTVMRPEDWGLLFDEANHRLSEGADACIAVTSYVDDESPLWVARGADGSVLAFRAEAVAPPLVTGGVYFLSSRVRDLAPRVISRGVTRMRGFLGWLVEHGYRVATADVPRIVDLDRRRDLAQAVRWLGGTPVPEGSPS